MVRATTAKNARTNSLYEPPAKIAQSFEEMIPKLGSAIGGFDPP
jgi:hypothetical protein